MSVQKQVCPLGPASSATVYIRHGFLTVVNHPETSGSKLRQVRINAVAGSIPALAGCKPTGALPDKLDSPRTYGLTYTDRGDLADNHQLEFACSQRGHTYLFRHVC